MSNQPPVDWLVIKSALITRFRFSEQDFATMSMEMFWGYVDILIQDRKRAGKPANMSHREWVQLQAKNAKPPTE